MSNKNFAGQKLDGRSFRGQDLRGADFNGCSLKSCDFRDADLTGANFRNSIFGVSLLRIVWKKLLEVLACVFVMAAALIVLFFSMVVVSALERKMYTAVLMFDVIIVGWAFVIYWVIKDQRPIYCVYYGFLILIIFEVYGFLIGIAPYSVFNVALTGIVLATSAIGVAMALVVSVAGKQVIFGLVAVTMVATVEDLGSKVTPELFFFLRSTLIGMLIYLLLGFFIKKKSIVDENNLLTWHRKYYLIWIGWGGVNFFGANLAFVNFSQADLRGVCFIGSSLFHSIFQNVSNFHLARTESTILSPKKVRVLLTEKNLIDRDFSGLNLRALCFANLDLVEVDFCQADLSEVDFSSCDLRGADLSEATVLGTNFERAQLTGAIIDQWNTDKRTCFDGVDCEYVYTKRDKSFKNPPHGTFKAGEFSKLYQEIANTVDFIVHTPEELQALLRAIESIKQQGGEIVIQSLERKNESVVVRTQSPEAIDKAAIYAQVREEMDSQIQLLKSEHEKQLLTQRIELGEMYHDKTMDSLIKMASQFNRPSSIIMNDHSRTISNSTLTNSATNLGDNSTVSNNVIEQVADAQLRTDLQKLHELLTHSTLPADDKKQAQQSVTELAQASEKPAAERKSMARRSLAFLKELREDLGSMADLGVQYGETLARVVLWFQGL